LVILISNYKVELSLEAESLIVHSFAISWMQRVKDTAVVWYLLKILIWNFILEKKFWKPILIVSKDDQK
jgi:hypothetical protein